MCRAGLFRLLLVLVGLVFAAAPARALSGNDLVQASLIAEPQQVRGGEPFWVAVSLRMAEHWHTYWRNPGDSGLATEVTWTLPPGFTAGPIVWPVPQAIPVAHLVNYGYEGEVMLLTQITPPKDAAPNPEIKADVNWLVCQKECIPGEASLSLAWPGDAAPFDAARAQVAQPAPWTASIASSADGYMLRVAAKGLKSETIKAVQFLPHGETLIEHAAVQPLGIDADGLTLQLKRSTYAAAGMPSDIGGLLLVTERTGAGDQRQAFEFTTIPTALPMQVADWSLIAQAALLALLGGIILNLMPCVFPVLSIKILALVGHAGEGRERMRRHGVAYTLGVLVSFGALATLLIGLRSAGAQIGWGFQLQMPLVVALLAYLLFAMGLSLSGVFHIGGRFAGIGEGLAQRGGYQSSFFTGVLAAVVATPCTAPFMGAAVGFALTQPAVIGISVFLALGFGLALPFLLLTFIPQLAERLPRPGLWMERVKQALAFPLYATVAWLIWVLSQQVGQTGLLAALLGLVLVAAAAWLFSLHGRFASGAAIATVLATAVALAGVARDPAMATAQTTVAETGVEAFSRQKLDMLVAQGKPVFVNMTAAWCITCMVNERTALGTDSVQDAFRAKGITYLKGDWTNQDPEITKILEQNGRSGVPLYLLYANGQTTVLPQILTPAIVLDHLSLLDRVGSRDQSLQTASLPNQTRSARP